MSRSLLRMHFNVNIYKHLMTSASGDPAAECSNFHCVTQLCQTIAGLPGCIKAVGDDPTTNPPLQQYV